MRWILRHLPWLLRRALVASFDDGLFATAKGVAYSALLSFFPVIASMIAVMVQIRADYVRRMLLRFLEQILPPGTADVVVAQFHTRGQRPVTLLVVAFLLSLWAGSSVIKSLIDGFNAAYRVPRNRSILMHAATGFALISLSVVPMLLASFLILFGGTVEAAVLTFLKVDPLFNPLTGTVELSARIGRYVIAFVACSTITAVLYYYGPYRRQRWQFVWPGAILATVLWLLATVGFGWYIRNITNYNLLYGGIGTSIALLIWMYLISAISLFGCEFNAEYERAIHNSSAIATP